MRPKSITRTITITITTALMVFAACGDADPTAPEDLTFASSLGVNLSQMTKTPSGLYYKDETVGTGTQAATGFNVTVEYAGWLHTGSQFDAGTIPFVLGIGQVIRGWDEGITGMRVGGQRLLVIPSELAYGKPGRGSIPSNATLVFRVTLKAASR